MSKKKLLIKKKSKKKLTSSMQIKLARVRKQRNYKGSAGEREAG